MCPYIPDQQSNTGMFVPTTNVWTLARVNSVSVTSPDFKALIVSLYQNINNIEIVLNKKDSAIYPLTPFVTGGQWFNKTPGRENIPRVEYRKVIDFGALGSATKSVAHGITWTATTRIVDIQCVATKTTVAYSALPIPYASSVDVAHNIELSLDATNVTITNGIDRSAYDACTIVIEYLQ